MRRGAKLVSETLRAGEGGDVGGPADDAAMHGPPKRRESHAHDLEDDEDGGAQGPGTGNGAQKERVGIASMTDRNWVLGKISAVVEGGGHPAEYFTGGELVFLGVSNLQLKHPKLMIHDVFSSKDNMVRNACVMLKILTADESSGDGHTLVLRGKTQAGGKSWTVTIEVDKADVANLAHLKRLRSVVDNKDAYLSQPELFRSYVNMELSSELKEAHSKYKKSQKQTTSGHSFTSQVPTKSVSRLGTGKRGALMMAATKDPEVIKAYHQNASAQRSNNTVGAYTAPSNDTGWISKMRDSQQQNTYRRLAPLTRHPALHSFSASSTKVSNLQGFRNLGNTCYMNAIASILVALPGLVYDLELLSSSLSLKGAKAPFTTALLSLCRASSSSGHGVLDMGVFKSAISARAKRFAGREQQDAHEFLTICMDAMGEEMSKAVSVAEGRVVPTIRNLGIAVKHTLRCDGSDGGCGYGRGKTESFLDLSLCIPEADKALSLDDLLGAFFADNHLEYTCEKCRHHQAKAKHAITKLPRYMTVHLKRFQPNWEKGTYEKSFTSVSIPETLDMSRFCTQRTESPPLPPPSALASPPRTSAPSVDAVKSASPFATPAKKMPMTDAASSSDLSLNDTVNAVSMSAGSTPVSPPRAALSLSAARATDFDAVPRKLSFESKGGLLSKDGGVSSEGFYGASPSSGFGAKRRYGAKSGGSALQKKARFANEPLGTRAREQKDFHQAVEHSLKDFSAEAFDASVYSFGDEDDDLARALALSAAEDAAAAAAEVVVDVDAGEVEEVDDGSEEEFTEAECAAAEKMRDAVDVEEEEPDPDVEPMGEVCPAKYTLVAVVSHTGASASSGHYISDVCDAKNRRWRRFDDSVVTTLGEWMPLAEEMRWKRNAYIAVYAHSCCFGK